MNWHMILIVFAGVIIVLGIISLRIEYFAAKKALNEYRKRSDVILKRSLSLLIPKGETDSWLPLMDLITDDSKRALKIQLEYMLKRYENDEEQMYISNAIATINRYLGED